MNKTKTTKSLAIKLLEAGKSIKDIEKNGWNAFHKYKYATGEDISKAFKNALNKVGIVTLIDFSDYSREVIKNGKEFFINIKAQITFIDAESGEKMSVTGYGDGVDSTDKGLYKAKTGAIKYLLLKTFLIPTGDDDPEKDTEKPIEKKSENMKKFGATLKQKDLIKSLCAQQSLSGADVSQLLKDNFNEFKISDLSQKQISSFIGMLLKLHKKPKQQTSDEDVPF